MADLTDDRLNEGENGAWHRHLTTEEMGALFSEVRRHRATMKRLEVWAAELDTAMVGTFIRHPDDHARGFAEELRNRIEGDANG